MKKTLMCSLVLLMSLALFSCTSGTSSKEKEKSYAGDYYLYDIIRSGNSEKETVVKEYRNREYYQWMEITEDGRFHWYEVTKGNQSEVLSGLFDASAAEIWSREDRSDAVKVEFAGDGTFTLAIGETVLRFAPKEFMEE